MIPKAHNPIPKEYIAIVTLYIAFHPNKLNFNNLLNCHAAVAVAAQQPTMATTIP